jgi:hypothetical protein
MNELELKDLPKNYGDTKIALLVRDPFWIFAYWEISRPSVEDFQKIYKLRWEHTKPAIKIVNITEKTFYFLYIDDAADNWHIEVGKPKTRFYVELGRVLPNYTFVPLCRSNTVTTPANSVSGIEDEYYTLLPKKEIVKRDIIYERIMKELQYGISTPGSPFIKKA